MTHQHDYIERFRRYWYPKLHGLLRRVEVGVPLFSKATTDEDRYAATFHIDEDTLEETFLHDLGFERNPIAAYKTHEDGRQSTLSIRLTNGVSENRGGQYVEPGMQLHATFFPSEYDDGTIDMYAHYEKDWARHPIQHLRGVGTNSLQGVKRVLALIHNSTYLSENEDYTIYGKER